MTRYEVAEVFTRKLGVPEEIIPENQTMLARGVLRDKFLAADIGITGANFLVADSGVVVLVENEGNARLTSSAPKIHIAIAGLEKLSPAKPAAAAAPGAALDEARARALMERLRLLLADNDTEATDTVEEFAELARGTPLSGALKQVASAVRVPPALEDRILRSVTPPWKRYAPGWTLRRQPFGVFAVAIVLALVVAVVGRTLDARAANTLDRVAINVDENSEVVIRGTLLCRDCELTHRYGIESSCQRIRHHGAIFTDGGVIFNLVEQRSSARLIHDETLFGRQVLIHGRLLRGARVLSVDAFEIQG